MNPYPVLSTAHSVAVRLCPFRVCMWQSADVRGMSLREVEDEYARHLRTFHHGDIAAMSTLMR